MNTESFVKRLMAGMSTDTSLSKSGVERLAATFGITDKNEVKELTELSIVKLAGIYARSSGTLKQNFAKIVSLYDKQVNLSHRTSNSILLQQYSTPAPIGYLMGIFCEIDQFHMKGGLGFEPSAGNGLLTIAADPRYMCVNEVDPFRRNNLKTLGFGSVWDLDATLPFQGLQGTFAAVLTNPPFGRLNEPVYFDEYEISSLEHLMALRALETMMDKGKAAIIIGEHTKWDDQGRIQAGKNRIFFNYLYSRFYIKDVININGKKLYSRQGTSIDVRLILIAGRKPQPSGVAPLHSTTQDKEVKSFNELYERVMDSMEGSPAWESSKPNNQIPMKRAQYEDRALRILEQLRSDATLGAPYIPASQSCFVLDTQVPDSMAFETQAAVDRIRREVGGDMDNFVRHRLGYRTKADLCKALSAEQIDAVGVAIYNIESRGQGMIIGDQTGIGKGRVAASIIRYATAQGMKPVFLTEKANLFSDIYRDLSAIGSGHLRPFIVNAKESKTDIKDEDGNIVYQAPDTTVQKNIIASQQLPFDYNFVLATYSQFNSAEKKPEKPAFLRAIAVGNIFILDEAHNSSGDSNTGYFLQNVVSETSGVVFLSATFAKRPSNMPIYAMKTAISDCTLTKEELVDAITKGGVALQEVISAQLVAEGQMLRRERSYEGIEVNYITLDSMMEEHSAITDNITQVLRDIISFQDVYVTRKVKALDKIAAAEGKEMELREGTSQAGVDNQPYFSKIFQVINQMLFSIKAKAVAERAIARLKEGKKPVIAFASTMGSFIETLEGENGAGIKEGDVINADFSEVLLRGLDGVLRYTEKDVNGKSIYKRFNLIELGTEAMEEYERIRSIISTVSTGITVSPIDVIIQILQKAGYRVAEVTGRKFALQLNLDTAMGMVLSRKKINTNDAFRQFNNNEVDVLMINQSGSTGASAHAIPTAKVLTAEVKQRVMIVLQAELDINTEVQKRGRINRTGQILKPIYDYVTSAIPAEKRMMMMLQKKLKSLDANTTSNQKQSNKILDVPDFLNKYGDKIVTEYLQENPEVNKILDNPLKLDVEEEVGSLGSAAIEDAAHKVSGRVAVLSTRMQADFYTDVSTRYNDYVEYLQQIGEYDLEVEAMNLRTETTKSRVLIAGNGSDSVFGNDSVLETVLADVLKKPFNRTDLDNLLVESLREGSPEEIQETLRSAYLQDWELRLNKELQDVDNRYDLLIQDIQYEKGIKKLENDPAKWRAAISERETELITAREAKRNTIKVNAENKKDYLLRIFKYYSPSRLVKYPSASYSGGTEMIPAVFLGYLVDIKKKNPFAPSQVRLRFAIAGSIKYLVLPASMSAELLGIIGASTDIVQPDRNILLDDWERFIKKTNVDRSTRHIITGNLLQAFGSKSGKLVSYNTIDGQVRKGILLPENWEPPESGKNEVTVPILKALPLIRSLVNGGQISTNIGLSIFKKDDKYRIIVSASRQRAGDIYLDKDLLSLVEGNNFQKVSNSMSATVHDNKIADFISVLQLSHGLSVTINDAQFRQIEHNAITTIRHKPINLPPPELVSVTNDPAHDKRRRLELEAKAIKIKLILLAA